MPAAPFPTGIARTAYISTPFNDGTTLWLWEPSALRWSPVVADPALAVKYLTAMPSGNSVTCAPFIDETVYLELTAATADFSMLLPSSANSRTGQIKIFVTNYPVTSFHLTVSGGGGRLAGNIPLTADAHTPYSFQCVSRSGSVWLRIA